LIETKLEIFRRLGKIEFYNLFLPTSKLSAYKEKIMKISMHLVSGKKSFPFFHGMTDKILNN
jgi:hypothetical protein